MATTGVTSYSVLDRGPGIPDYEIAVIESQSETVLDHSSGLGLWVVDWIVDQSDGTLTFDTSDGTRADITLDRVER